MAFFFFIFTVLNLQNSKDECCRQWQHEYKPKAESFAAVVRKSFKRVSTGNKVAF
jgi:hypothetical protein